MLISSGHLWTPALLRDDLVELDVALTADWEQTLHVPFGDVAVVLNEAAVDVAPINTHAVDALQRVDIDTIGIPRGPAVIAGWDGEHTTSLSDRQVNTLFGGTAPDAKRLDTSDLQALHGRRLLDAERFHINIVDASLSTLRSIAELFVIGDIDRGSIAATAELLKGH